MNTDIRELEEKLSVSLRRRVERVEPSSPHSRGWYEEAGRLRRRNRVTVIAACVAILGISVPVGIGALPDRVGSDKVQPADPPKPKLHKVSVDITKLPKGSAPKALWATGGVLHDGPKTIRPKVGPIGEIHKVVRLGDGYAVKYSSKGNVDDGHIAWIGPDGAKREDLPSLPVVSPDGKTAAFQKKTYDDESADLEAMDVYAGVGMSIHIKNPTSAAPRAFVGDKILYAQGNGQRQPAGLWDPTTAKLTSVGILIHEDGAARADLQVLVRGKDVKDACSDIYAGNLAKRLWRSCDDLVANFSPDGRYALAFHKKDLGGTENATTFIVYDSRSGRPLLELQGPAIDSTSVTTEPDGSILALALQGDREALVRCTIDGKCERASEIGKQNTFVVEGDY